MTEQISALPSSTPAVAEAAPHLAERTSRTPARRLLPLVIPALVVGVFSSVLLVVVNGTAKWLEALLWTTLPGMLGIGSDSPFWILLMLTLTGVAVGVTVWKIAGHAGPDPATTGLVSKPLPMFVLPGLAFALVLMLAGGVSLGPENPIMAIDIGVVVALGTRVIPTIAGPAWLGLATSGMIGAMFGTPVGAALAFPSVFIGVALGLTVSAFAPSVPPALAVACALLGVLLAIMRQGWLSLFLAIVIVPDVALLPVLTIVLLPAWLLVTGQPEMQLKPRAQEIGA